MRMFDFESNAFHLMLSAGNLMQGSNELPAIIFDQTQDFGITKQKVNLVNGKVYSTCSFLSISLKINYI